MFKMMLIFMSLFLITGCRGDDVSIDETLPVMVYFATEVGLGGDEWQSFIIITVNSDNVVTDVELNGVTQLANNSRREVAQLDDYEDLFGYNFYELASSLERSLIGLFRNELADAIRDAFDHEIVDFDTTTFADLASIALASAPVERGGYIDGFYRGIDPQDEEGFQYFVNLFVMNGKIVAVHFNALNNEGHFIYDPFVATTVDSEIIEWRHQAELLEQALIELQDPMALTFDEDGLPTDIPHVYIEIDSFVALVTQALAKGPLTLETYE